MLEQLKKSLGIRNNPALWKLTMGDILFKVNEDILCSFGSKYDTDHIKSYMLANSWHATDRENLLRVLQWLENEGHSASYDRMAARPSGEFASNFADTYAQQLQNTSLRAWDLGRLCFLVRLGEAAGYLSEDECWQWLDRIAPQAQRCYSSWEDYAEHYIIGRCFWQRSLVDNTDVVVHAIDYLLNNDNSPWRMIPWNTPLAKKSEIPLDQNNPYYFNHNSRDKDRLEEIRRHYETLIKFDPNANSYGSYGCFLRDIGEKDLAEDYFYKSVNAGAIWDYPFHNLIQGFQQRLEEGKNSEDVINAQIRIVFEFWIQRLPESANAHADFACWLYNNETDCDDEIESLYIKALELDAEHDPAHHNFAVFLEYVRKDYEWALQHYESALELNPGKQLYMNNMNSAREKLEKQRRETDE